MVAVPEGLPLAVTIALAFSVKKMMKDQVRQGTPRSYGGYPEHQNQSGGRVRGVRGQLRDHEIRHNHLRPNLISKP